MSAQRLLFSIAVGIAVRSRCVPAQDDDSLEDLDFSALQKQIEAAKKGPADNARIAEKCQREVHARESILMLPKPEELMADGFSTELGH
jgi:hypothetical protein